MKIETIKYLTMSFISSWLNVSQIDKFVTIVFPTYLSVEYFKPNTKVWGFNRKWWDESYQLLSAYYNVCHTNHFPQSLPFNCFVSNSTCISKLVHRPILCMRCLMDHAYFKHTFTCIGGWLLLLAVLKLLSVCYDTLLHCSNGTTPPPPPNWRVYCTSVAILTAPPLLLVDLLTVPVVQPWVAGLLKTIE